jgi:hypothetical protein
MHDNLLSDYELDSLGFILGRGRNSLFAAITKLGFGPTYSCIQWVLGETLSLGSRVAEKRKLSLSLV